LPDVKANLKVKSPALPVRIYWYRKAYKGIQREKGKRIRGYKEQGAAIYDTL